MKMTKRGPSWKALCNLHEIDFLIGIQLSCKIIVSSDFLPVGLSLSPKIRLTSNIIRRSLMSDLDFKIFLMYHVRLNYFSGDLLKITGTDDLCHLPSIFLSFR